MFSTFLVNSEVRLEQLWRIMDILVVTAGFYRSGSSPAAPSYHGPLLASRIRFWNSGILALPECPNWLGRDLGQVQDLRPGGQEWPPVSCLGCPGELFRASQESPN